MADNHDKTASDTDALETAQDVKPDDENTPINEADRTTGSGAHTGGKATAVQESGDSDPLAEGAGNQGTEKR